jgi:hypothetical protein
MGAIGVAPVPVAGSGAGAIQQPQQSPATTTSVNGSTTATPGVGEKMTKYSQWQFIYDPKNDHSKIYNSYHEGW